MKYYVYIHIRNDNNEPFYIGKGTQQNSGKKYSRAYHSYNRNKFWKNITNKTLYEVLIYKEFYTEEEALECEKALISQYGMRWNNTGILCNIEESGLSQKCSDYTKSFFNKIVHKYDFLGNYIESYKSYSEAALDNNVRVSDIGRCVNKLKRSIGGFQWSSELKEFLNPIREKRTSDKAVLQLDMDNDLIKEWKSTSEASRHLDINRSGIANCLCGIAKTAGGFIWKLKN